MPVIINQLDVQVTPAASAVGPTPVAPPGPMPPAVDVAEIVRQLAERELRTEAD